MSYFNFLNPQDVPMGPEGGGTPPPLDGPKGKVKKHYADIDSAYGDAVKVLDSMTFGGGLRGDVQPEIHKIAYAAKRRDDPIKLADDMRFLAGVRGGAPFSPEERKAMYDAADKLTKAYKAQGELEEMRQPGQALANSPGEFTGRQNWIASQIQNKQEQLKTAGTIRTPQLQDELKKLREEEGRVALAAKNPEYGPVDPPDLNSVLVASGMDQQKALSTIATMIDTVGLPNSLIHPGAFSLTLRSIMSSMGKAGDELMRGMIKAGTQPALEGAGQKAMQQPQKASQVADGRPRKDGLANDPYQQRIEQRQNEVMNAVNEIKNLKTFDSTWKVALFVLFSVIMGPGPAAVLFTNKAKRGELKAELDALEADLDRLMKMQDQNRRLQETARHNAIVEGQAQQRIDNDAFQDEWYRQYRMKSPRGKDPEYDAAMHGYRLAKDELDEQQDILNNTFNYSDAEVERAKRALVSSRKRVDMARSYVNKILNRQLEQAQQPNP